MDERAALAAMNRWAGQPLAVSATAWHEGELHVRLSGSAPAVGAAAEKIGGNAVQDMDFWRAIREQTHPFFSGPQPLWRLALPSTAAPLALAGRTLIEWGGGLRWLKSDADDRALRDAARRAQGHATLFRAKEKGAAVFSPLEPALMRIHRELKAAFDPAGILNPGRMYAEL